VSTHRLDGPRIKLARAARHIDELNEVASKYLQDKPYSIESVEESNGDLVWRLNIDRPVPLEWSAIVGDSVHNMRTALDLIVWQLVEANGNQPSRDTCFPIASGSGAQFEKALCRSLFGASDQAVKLVKRLKPYAGGNQTLSQLHALDVVDKHRLVLVVGAANKQLIVKMKMKVPWAEKPVEFPPIGLNPADRQFPLTQGEEVFRICAAARSSDVLSEHAVVFELAFGDVNEVQGHPLIPTLQSMHRHVSRIIDAIGKHLLS
jgi:hypothetical protein